MQVPFVDLHAQYLTISKEIDNAIRQVIEDASFVGGSRIEQFEKSFGAYINVKHVVGCANGTDSLEILLQGMGIGPGHEVLVPAISWVATSGAVSVVGAKPVFVDIDKDYYTMDPRLIEAKINKNTRAIIPVHLYGYPADMPAIMGIAKQYQLKVIEDCAQSHGAMINHTKTGNFGDAGSFSFYPGKNLGAYGDAGCMVTNDDALAEKIRMLANLGQKGKHNHLIEGRNSRMDTMQAAILQVKLPHLEKWTDLRRLHAEQYAKHLQNSRVALPVTEKDFHHVYHLFVVRVNNRPAVEKALAEQGVLTSVHYPCALPYLPCYQQYRHTPADFPVAHKYQHEILSLPMYAELTEEQIIYIADVIKKYT